MGTCGAALRKIAIFILVAAIIVLGIQFFTTLGDIDVERENFNEYKEDHEETHDYYHSDCNACESLEEAEAALSRKTTLAFTDAFHSLLWIGIGCAILYGIGEVAENLCNVESHTASKRYGTSPAPATDSSGLRSTMGAASATYCTKCGTALRPGAEFCSICGTPTKK